jgi:hypothetical protein
MITRIVLGNEAGAEPGGAKAMALELLNDKAIDAAWDLASGGFFNTVRVQSPQDVNDPPTRAAFDAMLTRTGRNFNVVVRNDSGQYAGVNGTPILPARR